MRPLWEDVKRIGTQIIPTEPERIISYFIDMYTGSYTYRYVYTAVIYIQKYFYYYLLSFYR